VGLFTAALVYRAGSHAKGTKHAVQAQTAYVQGRDRDAWLEEKPGRPFPESMLTAAEKKDHARAVRLNAATESELRGQLVVKWVLSSAAALFFLIASGGAAFVASIAIIVAMAYHHTSENKLWNDLHRERPWLAFVAIPPAEAERIVAEWQPPVDAPTVVLPVVR
jgi:hypothetical protein